jgi:hypothetical protein
LALVGLFPWLGLSLNVAIHQECVAAVFGIIGNLNFEGIGYGEYYLGLCQNPLKVTSVYAISRAYCPPNDLDTGFAYFGLACQTYGPVELIPEAEIAANLTDKAVSSFPILDQDDKRVLTNLTTPILISRDWFELGFRTEVRFLHPVLLNPFPHCLGELLRSYRTRGTMRPERMIPMGEIQFHRPTPSILTTSEC